SGSATSARSCCPTRPGPSSCARPRMRIDARSLRRAASACSTRGSAGAREQEGARLDTADAERSGVAVIVPAWRDTGAVLRLIDSAKTWRAAPGEIVVVSAEADPALAALVTAEGHRYVEAQANRGEQLDLGARSTSAPVLWFLHADAHAPADGIAAIGRALAAGAESGCFTFSFQGERTWYKAALEHAVAARVRLGGIPYGDQGLFATRSAYMACGGFAHQPLFEEVRLVRRL